MIGYSCLHSEIKTSEDIETLSIFHLNVKTKPKTQELICYYTGHIVTLQKKKIVFSSLSPSTFRHPFVIVFSSTMHFSPSVLSTKGSHSTLRAA